MSVHFRLITNAFDRLYNNNTHNKSWKKNDRKRHSSRAMLLTFIAIQTFFALCFLAMPEAIDFLLDALRLFPRLSIS